MKSLVLDPERGKEVSMCNEYWHEKKLQEEADERARREAREIIRKAKETPTKAPAPEPVVTETEKEPA